MFFGDTEEKAIVPSMNNGMCPEQIYKSGLKFLKTLSAVPLYTPVFGI